MSCVSFPTCLFKDDEYGYRHMADPISEEVRMAFKEGWRVILSIVKDKYEVRFSFNKIITDPLTWQSDTDLNRHTVINWFIALWQLKDECLNEFKTTMDSVKKAIWKAYPGSCDHGNEYTISETILWDLISEGIFERMLNV